MWERLSSLDDHGQKPVPTNQLTNAIDAMDAIDAINATDAIDAINAMNLRPKRWTLDAALFLRIIGTPHD